MPHFLSFLYEPTQDAGKPPPARMPQKPSRRKSRKRIMLEMMPRPDVHESCFGSSTDGTHMDSQDHMNDSCASLQSQNDCLHKDTIDTMLNLESSKKYRCSDYFYGNSGITMKRKKLRLTRDEPSHGRTSSLKKVDESCRDQICEWCYRLVDFFKVDREVVYIAMSYLDRFLVSCTCDRSMYKLAATTALLLGIKIHPSRKVILSDVITDLSRGEFTMKDIMKMEVLMLQALSWYVHPPTPMSFVVYFLHMSSQQLKASLDSEGVQDFAIFFVELSVCDYYFATRKASQTAFAAILNAVEGLGLWSSPQALSSISHDESVTKLISQLSTDSRCDHNSQEIREMRVRLWDLYEKSEEFAIHNKNKHEEQGIFCDSINPNTPMVSSRSRFSRGKSALELRLSSSSTSPRSITRSTSSSPMMF